MSVVLDRYVPALPFAFLFLFLFIFASYEYSLAPGITLGLDTLFLVILALLIVKFPTPVRMAWWAYACIGWVIYYAGPHTFGNGIDYVVAGFILLSIEKRIRAYGQFWAHEQCENFLNKCGVFGFFSGLIYSVISLAGLTIEIDFYITPTILLVLYGMSLRNRKQVLTSGVFRSIVAISVIGLVLSIVNFHIAGFSPRGFQGDFGGVSLSFGLSFVWFAPYVIGATVALLVGMLIRQHVESKGDDELGTEFIIYLGTILIELAIYRLRFEAINSGVSFRFDLYNYYTPVFALAFYAGFRYGLRGVVFVAASSVIVFTHSNIDLGRAVNEYGGDDREITFMFLETTLDNGLTLRSGARIMAPSFIDDLGTALGLSYLGHVLYRRWTKTVAQPEPDSGLTTS